MKGLGKIIEERIAKMDSVKMTAGDKIKLRAELAGKAMAAILSNYDLYNGLIESNPTTGNHVDVVAQGAVDAADALMKELGLDGE